MNTKNFSKNFNTQNSLRAVDKKAKKYYNKSNTNNKKHFKNMYNYFYNKYYIKRPNNTRKSKIYLSKFSNKSHLINNEHDKIFRIALSNKKDACKFIKSIINFKREITENDLQLYKTNFVTSEFRNREADVIYKIKNKNIFILIEHQTKIDYTMPYRILSYQHEIIKSAINMPNANTKNFDISTVIPIVLYTGKQKWNAKNSLNSMSINTYKELPLSYYYLIDINDYSVDTLLNDDLLISKLMILEKSRTNEDLIQGLEKILPKIKEEDKNFIINLINLILKEKIGKSKTIEYINKLKGGEEKMLACIEMIREDERRKIEISKRQGIKIGEARGIAIGFEKNKKEIAKKLLARNFSISDIIEITGLTKKEIKNTKE